jgi:serine phosphatase RsbU (regulator of sigma subunit)
MIATTANRQQAIEWSVASRALPGEDVSGDLHLVTTSNDGVLLAVIDGLGHGSEATAAAQLAKNVLEEHAGQSVIALVQHCHRALQRTRGVVMTLVVLDPREETLTALGVGNVEAVLIRGHAQTKPRRESVLLRGGVVGYQLPALQASVFPVVRGDLLVFATDGVREDFGDELNPSEPVAQVADRIIRRKFRGTDDGLVLACRYLGA